MPLPPASRRHVLAAYIAGVLVLTLVPVPEAVSDVFPSWFDKAAHVGLFASLAALRYWQRVAVGRLGALDVLGPAVALAGFIELAQGPIPHRSGDVWDFFWGVAGAVAGYLVVAAGRAAD